MNEETPNENAEPVKEKSPKAKKAITISNAYIMKIKLSLFFTLLTVALFGIGCASTIPASSFLNPKNLKELEKRSLNPNPSFEEGEKGWINAGGEIEAVNIELDLLGGKQAMLLKRCDGYTRLTPLNPVTLDAGKNYQMIAISRGPLGPGRPVINPSPLGFGDLDDLKIDKESTYLRENGKVIVTRSLSSVNGRTIKPTVYVFRGDLVVEHFFVIEGPGVTLFPKP